MKITTKYAFSNCTSFRRASLFTIILLYAITFLFLNAAAAEVTDLIKIPYGKAPGQLGASRISGEVMIRNPKAITFDGAGGVYIADAVNAKILKVNIGELKTGGLKAGSLKVSDLFSFAKSPAAGKTITDMAVINNGVYLLTLKGLFKFPAGGGKCDLTAKTGDKEKIRKPVFIFADGAGNPAVTDEFYENPQIISFDKNDKIVKTIKLKAGEEEYNTYASDGASKFYANTIAPDGFSVFAAVDPKSVILRYKKDPSEKLYIFFAHFIGFDSAKNMYCHVAYSEAEGPVRANYIYKFGRDQKLLKKAELALPEEDEIALAKPFMIVKEDLLVSYREAEDGFILTGIELK